MSHTVILVLIIFQHLGTLDSDESEIRAFYTFMPSCDSLNLGHVLLNYMHKMTRLVRNLLFIDMPLNNPQNIDIIIGPTHLTPRQIEERKLYNSLYII